MFVSLHYAKIDNSIQTISPVLWLFNVKVGDDRNIPFQIAIHDSEEDLEEKVDRVDQHSQQVQPSLSGHHDGTWGLDKG